MITPSIFRTYDIRGIVGDTLTEAAVRLIGQALGTLVQEHGEKTMVLARDGRFSSPTLSKVLAEGILATGCDVVDLGMVPTPLLYYAVYAFDMRSGVMLTGSHNPSNYNGLKMVVNRATLAEAEIKALYERILAKQFLTGAGEYRELNVIEDYAKKLMNDIHLARPLNIVIDAGNGVTGMMAPALFRALGCNVHELFCEVDGRFPHHHPDPGQPENLQDLRRVVQEKQADIGLAFDGDGDRLGVVTNQLEIIWPDRLLMLFAKDVLTTCKGASIIFDVKCTHHLSAHVQALGGIPIMWKTGHSLIKAKLAETNAKLAGEMSGHFFFKDRWYGFDDALYAAARLLQIIANQHEDAHTLFAAIPNSVNTPELKLAVTEDEKFHIMQALVNAADFNQAKEIIAIDGLRVNFADGWGLIRPSNTTPYLILRFEAISEVMLKNIQEEFRSWMLSVRPSWELPF